MINERLAEDYSAVPEGGVSVSGKPEVWFYCCSSRTTGQDMAKEINLISKIVLPLIFISVTLFLMNWVLVLYNGRPVYIGALFAIIFIWYSFQPYMRLMKSRDRLRSGVVAFTIVVSALLVAKSILTEPDVYVSFKYNLVIILVGVVSGAIFYRYRPAGHRDA
ncbi:hypothetical protein [Halorhabdus sp. BNX81]|uniref:hypothetical protein n=1 Tax=Halorhabdus sp. BNX81 TaxID=2980181 RepID=UPI0023DCED93|nr:hypothetical protein [Halorhabdus sp. BNX81]